jgi:hypothetical protein
MLKNLLKSPMLTTCVGLSLIGLPKISVSLTKGNLIAVVEGYCTGD